MSDPSAHEDPEDFPVAEIKVSRFADHDAATYPVYEGKNILGSDSRTARVYVRPGRLIMKTHLTIGKDSCPVGEALEIANNLLIVITIFIPQKIVAERKCLLLMNQNLKRYETLLASMRK